MNISFIVDGVDYTPNLILPIKWNALLDERLDEGRASLRNTSVSLFRIGAPIAITVENKTIDFIVSVDESTEMPVGSGMYNHELSLIEPTKILEGIVVENLTFTNILKHSNYPEIKISASFNGAIRPAQWWDDGGMISPIISDTSRTIRSYKSLMLGEGVELFNYTSQAKQYGYPEAKVIVRYANNSIDEFTQTRDDILNTNATITPKITGVVTITYEFYLPRIFTNLNGLWDKNSVIYLIDCIGNPSTIANWNIKSVIDRVLNVCESHLQKIKTNYSLDKNLNYFSQIAAPEFVFTNMTLKQILDQIGRFIHGVPRLIKDDYGLFTIIHYDMLGKMNDALIADTPYLSEIISQDIENYVTDLDSTADNFINTLDIDESALVEPYINGFKSLRSEKSYMRIEEGTMVIETTLPIYSVQKLEVITEDNKVRDITAFLYENTNYGHLSSFENRYPLSKSYAIYYKIGEKYIRGLDFKTPQIFGKATADYSIANIIKIATGWDITPEWWSSFAYPKLSFRITYTPIFSARVLQHKPYFGENSFKRTLAYNQNANLVETQFYGENMKGAVMRMGNPEIMRTYRKHDLSDMPQIGQIWAHDGFDYYVASITTAIYNDNVEITVGFSRDYNRLSQYIGINAEWRAYEVSERIAYYRDNIFTDCIVIGFDENIDADRNEIGEFVHHAVAATFAGAGTYASSDRITCALVTTYNEIEQKLFDVTLPVISTAFGNSLTFSFGMQDNFSAGAQSVFQEDNDDEIIGYWQTDVQYTDYYGRVKYVTYILGESGQKVGFGDDACFDLPAGNFVTDRFYGRPVRIKTDNKLVIDKDGNEILRFNYVVQFVTNDKDIIIGPALTKNNPMVGMRALNNSASLYIIQEKVNKFATTIDLSQATKVIDFGEATFSIYAKKFTLPTGVASVGGEAWAIADKNGALLLARNVVVEQNKSIEMPTFSINHKLP